MDKFLNLIDENWAIEIFIIKHIYKIGQEMLYLIIFLINNFSFNYNVVNVEIKKRRKREKINF